MPGDGSPCPDPLPAGDDAARAGEARERLEFTLVKGRHTWRFGCARGEEHLLIRAVAKLAREGQGGLTLADAALISSGAARRLSDDLDDFSAPRPSPGAPGVSSITIITPTPTPDSPRRERPRPEGRP